MKTGIITSDDYLCDVTLTFENVIIIDKLDSMKVLLFRLNNESVSKTEIYYIIE